MDLHFWLSLGVGRRHIANLENVKLVNECMCNLLEYRSSINHIGLCISAETIQVKSLAQGHNVQCLRVGFKFATPQPQVGLNNYYTHCAMYSLPMDSFCSKNCVVGDRSTLLILLQSLIKLHWTNLLIINLKLFQLVFFP